MRPQKSPEPRRAVFLDRDGVINKLVVRDASHVSPNRIEDFEWVEGIREAVETLRKLSFYVFVVTNQPDIARGKMSAETLDAMSKKIKHYLPIDDLMVCPHDSADDCPCRKPRAGMIFSLARKWNVDLSRSFVVGDTWKDMRAGKVAGCATILIEASYNKATEADLKATTIGQAVSLIERSGV